MRRDRRFPRKRSSKRALGALLRVLGEMERTLDASQSEGQGVRSARGGTESLPGVARLEESEDQRALREMFTRARIMRDARESCKWVEMRRCRTALDAVVRRSGYMAFEDALGQTFQRATEN